MCNHKFETKYHKKQNEKCYFNEILSEINQDYVSLSPDNNCLFHSDSLFNQSLDFHKILLEYVEYCDKQENIEFIDLRGVKLDYLELNGLCLNKVLNISNGVIKNNLKISNCQFYSELFLDKIIISDDFELTNCSIYKSFTSTQGSIFENNFTINESHFYSLFDIQNSVFKSQFVINTSTFDSYTIFDFCKFNDRSAWHTISCIFNSETTFKKASFLGSIVLENISINNILAFHQTDFKGKIFLQETKIKGSLEFKGLSSKNRMFQDSVHLNIEESSFTDNGFIYFENSNLTSLSPETKELLSILVDQRRIKLGKGSEVYTFYFQDTFHYSSLNQVLLFDLLTKIKDILENTHQVKIEFSIQKRKDSIVITYKSDKVKDLQNLMELQQTAIESTLTSLPKDLFNQYLKSQLQLLLSFAITQQDQLSISELSRFLTPKSRKLILELPNVKKVIAQSGSIINLINSPISLNNFSNKPEFNIPDNQFEEIKTLLKNQAIDFQALKTKIEAIEGQLDENQIQNFLYESGISITNSVTASVIFTFLQFFLLK